MTPGVVGGIIAAGAVVVVAAISGAYTVGYEQGAKDLESYTTSEGWKLPKTLVALNTAADRIESQLIDVQRLEELESEASKLLELISSLQKKSQDLEEKVGLLTIERDGLSDKMKEILRKTMEFSIVTGTAQSLIQNSVMLGLINVYPSSATISLLNEEHNLRPGSHVSFDFEGSVCKVFVVKVGSDFAEFKFGCSGGS